MRLRFWPYFLALASSALPAGAVGPRTFDLDTLEKLSGGDLKGVSVGSDGIVRAGFTLGNAPLGDATAAFCGTTLADGSTLVGTSPNGKIYKVIGDSVSVFAETNTLAVTSIVQAQNGTIYAATIPEAKIFKITPAGKAEVLTTLPDTSHVWALALDRAKTALYAATGPDGKVFSIHPDGTHNVYFQSDEPQLVSLAVGETGEVYAGSSGKGLLYKITAPGRASVVYDFPGEEVKAVGVAKGGVVWAIADEYGEPPEAPKRGATTRPAGPVTGARPKPGKGSLYRFDGTGRPEKMMHHDEYHYMSLTLDESGAPYVGTGAEGRVYTVNDAHVVTLVADTDERQVGALAVSGGKGFVASSDPAVFHRIVAIGGPDAVWTSKVLDAGLRARFGVLSWHATGALELSTRSGNTAAPDATWSAWSTPISAPGPSGAPLGRFVQVRARWGRDPKAALSEVILPFMTENVRPVVLEVTSAPKGAAASKETKEGIPASGGEPPKHESVVKVTWKVDNPDNDQLRYRVAFKREGQTQWRDALKPDEVLTKTELEWDTLALPEGKYRVRVEASDEISNPPETVQRHALESPSVLVDNTPPVFQAHPALAGRRLRARVVDGLGPITRIEMAVDGRLEWRPLAAADGLFDTADESIDADVSALVPPGSHIVAVRAFDAAGNAVIQETDSK
jgi:hypothetical protein